MAEWEPLQGSARQKSLWGIKAGVTPTEQTQLWKSSVCTLWAHRNSRIKISFKEEQHDDCSGIGFV